MEEDKPNRERLGANGAEKVRNNGACLGWLTPYILCIFCAICYAGSVVISKVCLNRGFSRYVLVAYGHGIGTLCTAVLALRFESAVGKMMGFAGLEYTSPTIAAAMANLLPPMTFILAVLCRMEKIDITKFSSQAKIGGTLMAFGGALLMALYKGITVVSFHDHRHKHQISSSTKSESLDWNLIKGSLLFIAQTLLVSLAYIIKATVVKKYPAPLTLTSLVSLAGTLVALVIAAALDHKPSSWRLSWNITLVAPLYHGIIMFGVYTWINFSVIRHKGPVFVTAFKPLSTVIAAIMGLIILREALYLGEIVGSTLIILGLYGTLWGKEVERDKVSLETTHAISHPRGIENVK